MLDAGSAAVGREAAPFNYLGASRFGLSAAPGPGFPRVPSSAVPRTSVPKGRAAYDERTARFVCRKSLARVRLRAEVDAEEMFLFVSYDGAKPPVRLRKWAWIGEVGKYLRVILLEDGETVHNAFFDRSFSKENSDED